MQGGRHACPPPAERPGHVDTTITATTKRSRWQMFHIDRPWEGDVMKSTHRSTRHNRTLLACALASRMLLAAQTALAQPTETGNASCGDRLVENGLDSGVPV